MEKSLNEDSKNSKKSRNNSKDFILVSLNSSETSFNELLSDNDKNFSINSSFSMENEIKNINESHKGKPSSENPHQLNDVLQEIINNRSNFNLSNSDKNLDSDILQPPTKLKKEKEKNKKKKLGSGKVEKLSKTQSNGSNAISTNLDSNSKFLSNKNTSEYKILQSLQSNNVLQSNMASNMGSSQQLNFSQNFQNINHMNQGYYPYSSNNIYNPNIQQQLYLNQFGMFYPNTIPYMYPYNMQNASKSDKNFVNFSNQPGPFFNSLIHQSDKDKCYILSYSKTNEFDKIYNLNENEYDKTNLNESKMDSSQKKLKKVKFKKSKQDKKESNFIEQKKAKKNSDFSKSSFSESHSNSQNIEFEKQLYDLESNFDSKVNINSYKEKINFDTMNNHQFIDYIMNLNGIASFICTHNGCKIFQKKITLYDEDLSILIINDILKHKALEDVMTSIYANYIFQKALEKSNSETRIKILKKLKKVNGSSFFTNASCSHSFQFMCTKINSEEEYELIDKIISRDCFNLSKDKNGSHVVMKTIVHIPEKFRVKLNSKLIEYCHILSFEKYGVCVVSFILHLDKKIIFRNKKYQIENY